MHTPSPPLAIPKVVYQSLRAAKADEAELAQMRRKRLNKERNHWGAAIVLDLLWGAGTWIVGVVAVASGLFVIHEHVDGAPAAFLQCAAPAAIGVIGTFAAFLLVTKIQANLACNSTIVREFNNMTGSLINLALWVKSQVLSGKPFAAPLVLSDGNDNTYVTNQIGMTLASVPYIVKYSGRDVHIIPEGLPLGQSAELVAAFKSYTQTNATGTTGSMTPFAAVVLMLGEQIDAIQRNEKKDTEYAVLFAQLNAVTGAEGNIRAATGYNPPYILDALLYVVFALFLILTIVSDLIPNNGVNAIWIAPILAFCTVVFFQISDRYWNPMSLRSKRSGQQPLISQMCVATELAILAVFSRRPLAAQAAEHAALASPAPAPPSSFRLRLGGA